jgi:hypothetical protein
MRGSPPHGQIEVVRKIGIDPKRDDPTHLFDQYYFSPKSDLIQLVIAKGADVIRASYEPINSIFFVPLELRYRASKQSNAN